jgi:hypothetical protein
MTLANKAARGKEQTTIMDKLVCRRQTGIRILDRDGRDCQYVFVLFKALPLRWK